VSKFDRMLIVAVAVFAGGVLWIEHGRGVVIEGPAAAELSMSAAAPCPDNDTTPYDAHCLEYLKVPGQPAPRPQVPVSLVVPAPCPDNDKVPYSASCIAFLKGPTETAMRWRVTDTPQR